jgi:hypothetical protein
MKAPPAPSEAIWGNCWLIGARQTAVPSGNHVANTFGEDTKTISDAMAISPVAVRSRFMTTPSPDIRPEIQETVCDLSPFLIQTPIISYYLAGIKLSLSVVVGLMNRVALPSGSSGRAGVG